MHKTLQGHVWINVNYYSHFKLQDHVKNIVLSLISHTLKITNV